jgi:hypothetical protein
MPLPGFDVDKHEVSFGFMMVTISLRTKKEPFEMSVPMMINIGKLRRNVPAQQPPPPAS